jgi:hypothetical protein
MIKKMHLPKNQFSNPGMPIDEFRACVFHYPISIKCSGERLFRYFKSLKDQNPHDDIKDTYVSTQYGITPKGIYEYIKLGDVAYSVGAPLYTEEAKRLFPDHTTNKYDKDHGHYMTPNYITVNAEMYQIDKEGTHDKETLDHGINWAVYIHMCFRTEPTPQTIQRHFDITGKICPRMFVKDQRKWNDYKHMIFDKYRKEIHNQRLWMNAVETGNITR